MLLGILILGLWAGLDLQQMLEVWPSDLTLWKHAVELAPEKPRPHLNYGKELNLVGDLTGAEREYRQARALALDPRRSPEQQVSVSESADSNLAHVLIQRGQPLAAKRMLDALLDADPSLGIALYNRSVAEQMLDQCDAANRDYLLAMKQAGVTVKGLTCGPLRRR